MEIIYCLNRTKVVCQPNTIQIILKDENKLFNKLFERIHKANICQINNETNFLTNIRVELIKNPLINICIHDYDTKYSLILKIKQILSTFNYDDGSKVKIKYHIYYN